MIGFGICVAPVVVVLFCPSEALICTSRPLGAGLGIGTVCARDSVIVPPIDTAIRSASAPRAARIEAVGLAGKENRLAIRGFCVPVNGSSCPVRVSLHFYRASCKGGNASFRRG
jgi:hypothetical protein